MELYYFEYARPSFIPVKRYLLVGRSVDSLEHSVQHCKRRQKHGLFSQTPCQRNRYTILGIYEVWHPVFQGKHRDPMFFEGKTSNTYPDQVERCLTERRSWCKYSDPHPSRVEGYFPLLSKKVCSVNVTVFTIIYIIVKI